MPEPTSADDALAQLAQTEPDIHEAVNQLVATRGSPGFLVLLKYFDGVANQAIEDLIEADALDTKEIMRLQNEVKRFREYAEAPDRLIRSAVGDEIAEEQAATQYED